MWKLLSLLLAISQLLGISGNEAWEDASSIYDFYAEVQRQGVVDLKIYKDHPVLIVNIAASCFPENYYNQLNDLYDKYSNKGLRIIVLPSRQFYKLDAPCVEWDARSNPNIKNIKYDVFAPVEVFGPLAHPLWKYLNKKQPKKTTSSREALLNYDKFIINGRGQPVARFGSSVEPKDLESNLQPYVQ